MKTINIAPVQSFLSREVTPTEMAQSIDLAMIYIIEAFSLNGSVLDQRMFAHINGLHSLRNVLLLADGNTTFEEEG